MTSNIAPTRSTAGSPVGEGVERPVFIVGPSRSGTALARAMLNGHRDVELAGETHYFDDLRPRLDDPEDGNLSDADRRQCQDYFLALSDRPYGHGGDPRNGWMARDELDAEARDRGGSADAYFEAFCRLSAANKGCHRWGEKTPRHVFRIADIVERYPEARVLCMLRDPRAVIASYRDWTVNQGGLGDDLSDDHVRALESELQRTRQSYDLLLASLLWRSQAKAILSARATFGNAIRIERYESLIEQPETEARAIATFVDLGFEPSMLDVPVLNSSFDRFDVGGGISQAPLNRWRSLLSPVEVAVIQQTCGSLMSRLGYERVASPAPLTAVGSYWARLPVKVVRAGLANRDRMGNRFSYTWQRVRPLIRRHA